MSSDQFVFWLQGFFELSDSKNLDSNQVDTIKDHLKLVFNKVTPDRSYDLRDDCLKVATLCGQKELPFPELMNIPPGASC